MVAQHARKIIDGARSGYVWMVSDHSHGYTITGFTDRDFRLAFRAEGDREVIALVEGFRARGAIPFLVKGSDGVTVLAFGTQPQPNQ